MGWAITIGVARAAESGMAAQGGVAWGALLGIVLGWVLKTVADVFMESRRRREATEARREQRFDKLRERRIDAERANLLSVQPMVTDFMLAGAHCSRSTRWVKDEGDFIGAEFEVHREGMRVQSAAIMPIRSRLHDREIAALLGALTSAGMNAIHQPQVEESIKRWEAVVLIARDAHNEIGSAIRSLEDESIQLGTPPA